MHFNCTRFFLTWSSCKCHSEGPEGNHGNVCSGGHRIASKCLSVFRYLTLYHKQTSDQEHGSDVFWLQVCSWVFRYPIQVAQTNTGFWSGCRSVGLPSFSLTCSFPFPVVCSWVWLLVPPETHLKFISSSPAVIKAWSLHRSSARLLCHAQWLHLCSCWPSVFYLSVQGSRVLFASCSCCSVFSTAGRRLTPVCFPLLVCRSSVSLCSAVLLSPSGWFDWLWAVAACFSGFLFIRSFPSQWWRIIFWSSSHLSLSAVTENGWGQKRLEKKNAYGSRVCNTFCSASESTSLQSSVQNIYIHYWHHRLRLNRNDTERP